MKTLITGANGLIGSHLVRALARRDYEVRGLVRATSDLRNLENAEIELAIGDILQPETLADAMQDCDLVFHTAAVFAYWGYKKSELIEIAKTGTENVLNAAAKAGVPRVILTSSSVTIGSTDQPIALSEKDNRPYADDPPYVNAKIEQERLAFEQAKQLEIELMAVCPTITLGAPDFGLTESTQMMVNYLKDPLKASWIGGCNLVAAKDVAEAHILVSEKGQVGERYIVGAENLEWQEVHTLLSEICGFPGPYITAHHTTAYLAAAWYEAWHLFTGGAPPSSRAQAKMVGRYYWYNNDKIKQLGYAPGSAKQALVTALSWLITSEFIPASLRASMELSPELRQYRNLKPIMTSLDE